MAQKTGTKKTVFQRNDTPETLKNTPVTRPGRLGSDMLDQIFGNYSPEELIERREAPAQHEQPRTQRREQLFRYQEYHEREIVREKVGELTELIRKEIKLLEKTDSSLISEVKDVEKLTVNPLPEKPGVYHVRFLEIILSLIRTIRLRIGESKTWLEALMTKKKKRGSLFVTRSKKMGTQYSLSSELQVTRSVQ
ncbi:hypothetical protein HYT33_00680 [Candidatus Roizmanbacteria bacterium]|nr:hypothetical protein [Candidatus Roizmanbacteria bacterium]